MQELYIGFRVVRETGDLKFDTQLVLAVQEVMASDRITYVVEDLYGTGKRFSQNDFEARYRKVTPPEFRLIEKCENT